MSKPKPAVRSAEATQRLPKTDEYDGPTTDDIEKFSFIFPESVRKKNDPKVVVIKELSEKELNAAEKIGLAKSKGDKTKQPRETLYASIKTSLVSVAFDIDDEGYPADLRPVNHSDNEDDVLWKKWSQKVKYQCIVAFKKVNQTSESEDADFLNSMKPC